MDPYYVFPRELWEMIYNLVEHPEDKLNLMRAHPNLSNQFGGIEKEEQLLFPSALTYVLTHLESSGRQMDNEERKALKEVFLACRLVSSFSCVAVDKWVESYWKKSTGDHQPPSFFQSVRLEPCLTTTLLDKFLEDFKNDPCKTRTPLLGRVATFPVSMFGFDWMRASHRRKARAFERKLNEKRVAVFGKIGPHLRKLEVRFAKDYSDDEGLCLAERNSVQNVLELCPNLKSLIFNFPGWGIGMDIGNNRAFLLPKLPRLDHLKVIGDRLLETTIASMLVYFPRLKELEIGMRNFNDQILAMRLFRKLKLLKLTAASSFEFPEKEEILKKIFERISAPNLTRIEVKLLVYLSCPIHNLEEVKKSALRCLNKNPVFSRKKGLRWDVTTVLRNAGDNAELLTLIFSRNINQQQNPEDQTV